MKIRNLSDANRECVYGMDRKQAVEASLSIRENSIRNRNTQIFAIIICALSGAYIAIVIDAKLLLVYIVLVSVSFLVCSLRTYLTIHLRIGKLLTYYQQKKIS